MKISRPFVCHCDCSSSVKRCMQFLWYHSPLTLDHGLSGVVHHSANAVYLLRGNVLVLSASRNPPFSVHLEMASFAILQGTLLCGHVSHHNSGLMWGLYHCKGQWQMLLYRVHNLRTLHISHSELNVPIRS